MKNVYLDGSLEGSKKQIIDKNVIVFGSMTPKMKRASHLPIISAREEYGNIFRYIKPLNDINQSRSMYKITK